VKPFKGPEAKEKQKQCLSRNNCTSGIQELSVNSSRQRQRQKSAESQPLGKRSQSHADLLGQQAIPINEAWKDFLKFKGNKTLRGSGLFKKGAICKEGNGQRKLMINHSFIDLEAPLVSEMQNSQRRAKLNRPSSKDLQNAEIVPKNIQKIIPKAKRPGNNFLSFIGESEQAEKQKEKVSKTYFSHESQDLKFRRAPSEKDFGQNPNDSISKFLKKCLEKGLISKDVIFALIEERQKEMELEQTAAKAPKTSSNNASTFKRNKRRSIQETFKHNPIIAEILESMLLDVEGDFTEASLKSRIVF
jgi:hypothetical protein